MPAKVNTQFIAIILATVTIAAGGVAMLWYWQKRGDVQRLVQQGDELFAQGEYWQAMEQYGRAARRDEGNVEHLRRVEKAIMAQRPETPERARDLYMRRMQVLHLEAQYLATDPDAHLRLIAELHRTARLMQRFAGLPTQQSAWHDVASAANQMLTRVPEGASGRTYGYLYRGMGNLHRARTLTEQELVQAEQDLKTFNEEVPNHDRGWAALARGQMLLEERARISGDPRRLATRRARLAEVMHEARRAVPDGPEVAAAYATYLMRVDTHPADAPQPTEVDLDQVIDELMAAITVMEEKEDPDSQWLTLDAVDVLLRRGGIGNRRLAVRLMEQHLERNPEAIAHHYMIANLLVHTGEFVEAQQRLEEILASGAAPVGLIAHLQPAVQAAAVALLAEIEYRRWSTEPDNPEHIKAMRAACDRLNRHIADVENDPRAIRAKGHLALMENRVADAAAKFERLIREGTTDIQVLTASAYSLNRLGEVGLAHERITAATELPDIIPSTLLLKAELEVTLGRLELAEETARQYLAEISPGDVQAAELGERLLRTISARKQGIAYSSDDPAESALHRAQSALTEGGSVEGVERARAILVAALDAHPEDVRLLGMLASVEVNAGDTESAKAYVARGLAIQPENSLLQRLDLLVRSGNPIEAAVEFFGRVEDEVERNAAVLRSVSALRAQDRERAARIAQREGTGSSVYRETVDRINQADDVISEARSRLRQLSANHAVLIEHEFNEAIAAGDWSLAGQIVQRARQHDADGSRGLLYEGRFELERRPPRPEHAVRAFIAATEQRPFSNVAWRGLAIAYQRVGNFREAVRAFDQAYTINPNDAQTIRGFLGLLIQVGDRVRAMRVARDAVRVMPNDAELRELWLDLELEHHNIQVVVDRRRALYNQNPGDRLNAMRLSLILASTDPPYQMLRDEQGRQRFTERQWTPIRPREQQRLIAAERDAWRAEAERIVNEIAARDSARAERDAIPDLEIVALRATVMRMRGDAGGGQKVLHDYIASLEAAKAEGRELPTPLSRAILALANFQHELGLSSEAVATMVRARQHQDPNVREAELALADYYFNRGQFSQALELYEAVQRVAPRRTTELRITECAINLRQFDRAENVLANLSPLGPTDSPRATSAAESNYLVEILRAMIARGRAEDMFLRGRTTDGERQMERFRAALEAAERLSPANPAPHILRAQAKAAEYRRTGHRTVMEDALKHLDRAESIRAGDPQILMARVEIHRQVGSARAAMTELNRLLERHPDHIQGRQTLVQLQVEAGNLSGAIDTVERAIELYPMVPTWHEMHGNLLAQGGPNRNPDRAGSAAAFRRAFELTRSPAMLSRVVATLITPASAEITARGDRPDFAAALQLLQAERELVEREPSLEAVLAHVLKGAGREQEAGQRLVRSYNRMRAQIDQGLRRPSDIGLWHQAAAPALIGMPTAEIESMIRSVDSDLPDHHDLQWLARREYAQGRHAMSNALALFRRALEAPGADASFRASVLFEKSGIHIVMEEYSAAVDVLQEVVSAAPSNWIAFNNLAFVKADRLNQADAALPIALRAAELRPDDASVLDTVGWVYFKMGDLTRAEQFLQRSLNITETARTQLHMAHVLSETGRFDAALSRLRRAAELNPDPKTQADIDRLTDDIRTKRASAQ